MAKPDGNAGRGDTAGDSHPARRRQTLSRQQRITRNSEFQEAYDQGIRYHGRYMVMWLRKGENAGLRLGVVTSRRVGNAACRVRARRRLREAYRRHRAEFHGAVDVVLVARQPVLDATWEELVTDLLILAKKAGMVRTATGSNNDGRSGKSENE